MIKILIIEDDITLCDGIFAALKSKENDIYKCHNIKNAKEIIENYVFDLIILDINLPDGNGINFMKSIKNKITTPIILLTANDLESDIVFGLENGAEDYITKPFSLAVLRARVNTQLRKNLSTTVYEQGEFIFDFDKLKFFVSGVEISFSKTEQKLLKIFIANKGATLERGQLVDKIWTDEAEFVEENALSVTVKRLRAKLGKNDCIKTIYGIGYVWVV